MNLDRILLILEYKLLLGKNPELGDESRKKKWKRFEA